MIILSELIEKLNELQTQVDYLSRLENISVSGTLASGRIPFTSAAGQLATDPSLVWDAANDRMGIGMTPGYPLDVNGSLRVSGIVVEDWQTPTLAGTWKDFLGGNTTTQYYKDPLGRVHLKGTLVSGSASSTIFTLPAGYRPSERMRFAVGANSAYGEVQISAAGTVSHVTGSTTFFHLDGVSFRAS